MSETACALLLLLLLVYMVMMGRGRTREHFVSKEAKDLHRITTPLYSEKGDATTYSEFKVRVEPAISNVGVDLFADTKKAFINNPRDYTPEKIQSILA